MLSPFFADLDRVYRDTKAFSSDKKVEFLPKYGDTPLYEHHTTSLVFNDPPLHTRVRKIMMGALTPRAISAMEPGLIRLVDSLLDAMEEKGKVDLIEDFAAAIPLEVIGNLFVMPHEERGPLARLVAGHPRRARAGADRGAEGKRATARSSSSRPICAILVAHRRSNPRRPRDRRPDAADRRHAGGRGAFPKPNCCRTASSSSTPVTRRRPI